MAQADNLTRTSRRFGGDNDKVSTDNGAPNRRQTAALIKIGALILMCNADVGGRSPHNIGINHAPILAHWLLDKKINWRQKINDNSGYTLNYCH